MDNDEHLRDERLCVFLIDDDASVRDSLSLLLGIRGYATRVFDSADAFLHAAGEGGDAWAGCVLTDIRMPGLSGLDLQRVAGERGMPLPFVVMSAHGDAAAARQAFRQAAIDFLEKPFDDADLFAAIEQAFARERERLAAVRREHTVSGRLASLTEREREVCDLMVQGLSNHEIAARLGISHRTAQVHRGRVMQKMDAGSLAALIAACREG